MTIDELKKLPDFPTEFYEADHSGRLDWLKQQLKSADSEVKLYQIERAITAVYYAQRDTQNLQQICKKFIPLQPDFTMRRICARAIYDDYDEYISTLYELYKDAEKADDMNRVAITLGEMAWRQSQEGHIAEAFENYQMALDKGKGIDQDTLIGIMFNTATSYIVNGDEEYIKKGVKILHEIIERNNEIIATEEKKNLVKNYSLDLAKTRNVQAWFNIGIANMLHLYDNEKALEYFDKISFTDTALGKDSLSFSALAAAELGQFDRAQKYLEQLGDHKRSSEVLESYLQCYRDLAQYRWNDKHSVRSCLNMHPSTTTEVTYDVYNRLSDLEDESIELAGLRKLRELVVNKLVPELKNHGSKAASAAELNRLQRESEMKTQLLDKERQLKASETARHETEKKYFVALFFLFVFFTALVISQLQQKKRLANQFEKMSTQDPLTGLGNRRYLLQQIEREIAFIERSHQTEKPNALGIFIFDIDLFKQVNDTHGHHIGDEVLVELSKRVKETIRDTDLLVRWGGEEFVLTTRLENNQQVSMIANRIKKAVSAKPFVLPSNLTLNISCTIGAVKYPFVIEEEVTSIWSKLISLADTALYYGKQHHRDSWVVINNEDIHDAEQLNQLLKQPIEKSIEMKLITVDTSFENIDRI